MSTSQTRRCRFCRRTDGELLLQPASDDFRPGRPGYRAIGFGASYYHAECLAEFERFEAASKARYQAEFERELEAARAQLREVSRG